MVCTLMGVGQAAMSFCERSGKKQRAFPVAKRYGFLELLKVRRVAAGRIIGKSDRFRRLRYRTGRSQL